MIYYIQSIKLPQHKVHLACLEAFGFHWLGGLQLASEQREDSYHFLVFTDLLGNRTHGVVVQSYRAVQVKKKPNL